MEGQHEIFGKHVDFNLIIEVVLAESLEMR